MPRNIIIYQSEALYVGPSPATGIHFHQYSGLTGDQAINSSDRVPYTLAVGKANELSASGQKVRITLFTGVSGSNAVGDVYSYLGQNALSAVGKAKTQEVMLTGTNRIHQLHKFYVHNTLSFTKLYAILYMTIPFRSLILSSYIYKYFLYQELFFV